MSTCHRPFRQLWRALWTLIIAILVGLSFPAFPRNRNYGPLPPDFTLLAGTTDGALPRRSAALELTGRVLLRLEQSEKQENNPHFRDDIRIAWITALYAVRGEPQPHVRATQAVLGVHPDEVFTVITERRMAKLGGEYSSLYDEAGNLIEQNVEQFFGASSPKKPVRSVRPGSDREGAA